MAGIDLSTFAHCLAGRIVVQELNCRICDSGWILEGNQHPAPIVQEIGGVPVWNRNDRLREQPAAKASRRTAGEGSGHTARVHVSEESHRGIVPMNHSNKDGASSAESEEGRLLIKENTFPSDTYPTLSGIVRVPRVEESAPVRVRGGQPAMVVLTAINSC